jgi:hypothetical protein
MFQSKKPDPINVPVRGGVRGGSSAFNAQMFFESIPSNRERAMSMLRSQIPDDGPPTPRAQAYIDSGEWDSGVLLQLGFVSSDLCVGRVGSVTDGDEAQFCGLRKSDCSSRSHTLLSWKFFRPGWHIPGGSNKGVGFFRQPSLPSADAGGPITSTIAQCLRDKVDPFAVSVRMCIVRIEVT